MQTSKTRLLDWAIVTNPLDAESVIVLLKASPETHKVIPKIYKTQSAPKVLGEILNLFSFAIFESYHTF